MQSLDANTHKDGMSILKPFATLDTHIALYGEFRILVHTALLGISSFFQERPFATPCLTAIRPCRFSILVIDYEQCGRIVTASYHRLLMAFCTHRIR